MSKKVLFLVPAVVVLAFGGTARAAALDVNNFSFEYDVDGNQITCSGGTMDDYIMGWYQGGAALFAGRSVSCACPNACDNCWDPNSTNFPDGYVIAFFQTDVYIYQIKGDVFEAGRRYILGWEGLGWGDVMVGSLFYGDNPDANEVASEGVALTSSGEQPWTWNHGELVFEVEEGASCIGKTIGIKLFAAGGAGDYLFADVVTLDKEWATTAWDEDPADGSDEVDKDVVLKWRPGLWVDDVNGHEVYFGTSFAEVNDADSSDTTGVYRGPDDVGSYADPCDAAKTIYTYDPPETLSLVTTYYWRVDEVNESYSGSTPPTPPGGRWKGEVWSFEVEGRAKEPYPADGAGGVAVDVVLHWTPGRDAVTHDVYFGTDETAVSTATTSSAEFMGNQGPNTFDTADYDANGLVYAGEYFWRVDEVGASTVKGHIWSFIVAAYSTVDDFESYNNDPALYAVWDDYWTNGTGAEIFVETDPDFVRDGNSLEYHYDNTDKVAGKWIGSVADADIADLEIGSDWTKSGAKALVLYFKGKAANAVGINDRMWVEIEDTSSNTGLAIYNGNPNDVTIPECHEWNIELSLFDACGVSLANVDKIHLGFGDQLRSGQSARGGTGTVWFDEIAVHPPRCVPSYSKGKGDFAFADEDCFIDLMDVKALARDWLESGVWVSASAPPTPPLLWFKFDEGAGTTTANSGSLGSSRNGNLIDMFDPWVTPGAPAPDACDPNACLAFDGTNDYVNSPNMGIATDELTISAWLKRSGDEFIFAGVLIVPGANDFNAMTGMQFGSTPNWNPTNTINYVWESMESTWGWDTGLLVPEAQWTFAAAVVEPTKATVWMHDGTEMSSATNIVDHGVVTFSRETYIGLNPKRNNKGALVRWYSGEMDDVRLYDYALSEGEVLYLVDHVGQFYQPLEDWRADADKDDTVNFVDHAYMAENWLTEILWPEP
jgi:hypothetical protein